MGEQVKQYHKEAIAQIQSAWQSTEKMILFLQQISDIKKGVWTTTK